MQKLLSILSLAIIAVPPVSAAPRLDLSFCRSEEPKVFIVSGSSLRVRSAPSVKASALGALPKGTMVATEGCGPEDTVDRVRGRWLAWFGGFLFSGHLQYSGDKVGVLKYHTPDYCSLSKETPNSLHCYRNLGVTRPDDTLRTFSLAMTTRVTFWRTTCSDKKGTITVFSALKQLPETDQRPSFVDYLFFGERESLVQINRLESPYECH